MSEPIKGFIVTLDRDLKDEEAERALTAIGMVRGVTAIAPIPALGYEDVMARQRVRIELSEAFRKLVKEILEVR